jgi:hypothetical protein
MNVIHISRDLEFDLILSEVSEVLQAHHVLEDEESAEDKVRG